MKEQENIEFLKTLKQFDKHLFGNDSFVSVGECYIIELRREDRRQEER